MRPVAIPWIAPAPAPAPARPRARTTDNLNFSSLNHWMRLSSFSSSAWRCRFRLGFHHFVSPSCPVVLYSLYLRTFVRTFVLTDF